MAEPSKYRVGQTIVVNGKEEVITKVGREYGYYGRGTIYRFSLATGWTVSDRGSKNYVYPSKEEHQKALRRESAWMILRSHMGRHYQPPKDFDCTEEGLTELYRLLGIERATPS
jgi:hypothetical protein